MRTIHEARTFVPGYGAGTPITEAEIRSLTNGVRIHVSRSAMDMDSPAVLTPPLNGRHHVIVASWVGPDVLRHIKLHEAGHVLMGDIDEPTYLSWTGPMPASEDLADMFSLIALLDRSEIHQGPEYLEGRIRELVPLDNYGWQTYRVPRLAGRLGQVVRWLEE